MADLGGQFDAAKVDPMGEFQPLPAGEYRCVCIRSEWKPTKTGNGRYLQFDWEVIEGDHKGQRVASRLNLENPSQQAVNIARSELSSICRAVGVLTPRDTGELHNIPCVVKVAIKPREDQPGSFSNEIKGYSSIRTHAEKQPEPVSAGASAKPSWMN